jgi:flagellar biosynthesis/type III secretory pathway protein FliH
MDGKYYKENKVMRIDDINAMADADIRVNERIEKLAEEVYGKGVNQDYEEGFVDGYNKAKETLYTEEQVREAMEFARGHSKITDTQFIETLKLK